MDPDIADLRALHRFAALGSLAAAADALNLTPSAMGRRIARLEAAFGTALLDRGHRPPRLTRAGETAAAYADRLLTLSDEMTAALRADGADGSVRLGVPHDIADVLLPPCLARFRQDHPGIAVTLRTGTTPVLLGELAADRLDLCVTTERYPPPTSLVAGWVPLVWLAAEQSLASHRPLPLILSGASCTFRPALLEALGRAGRSWRIVAEQPSMEALIAMVRAGYGITALLNLAAPADLARLATAREEDRHGCSTGQATDGAKDPHLPSLPDFAIAVHRAKHASRPARLLAEALVETPLKTA